MIKKIYDENKRCVQVMEAIEGKNLSDCHQVNILNLSNYGDDIKVWGINWSAHGTVSIAETKKYIELINIAIGEANSNNIKENLGE